MTFDMGSLLLTATAATPDRGRGCAMACRPSRTRTHIRSRILITVLFADYKGIRNQRRPRSAVNHSLRQLKSFKSIQLFLDSALEILARALCRALADPTPFLHQQFLVLAVGLEIDRRDDVFADQDRQREIAEQALFLRQIGLETVAVIEEQFGALALDDQGIER